MKKQDYTTLQSHYIPNKKKYHFTFPLKILNEYNGIDNLDVTIDDNLSYFIIQPILQNKIEYNFELIWKNENNLDYLDILIKINDAKFNSNIVIDNLVKHKMITGLKLYKEEFGKLTQIY